MLATYKIWAVCMRPNSVPVFTIKEIDIKQVPIRTHIAYNIHPSSREETSESDIFDVLTTAESESVRFAV